MPSVEVSHVIKSFVDKPAVGMAGVPAWQLIASIGVLVLSIIRGLFLAARLLRTYLLLYGKRPGLAEIIRNLRSG